MRYALSCLLAAVLFVGGPALAQAGCYGTSYYTPTYYAQPTYEQKVVVNNVVNKVTVLEYVPLYAVGLASPYAVPTVPVAPAVTAAPSTCEQKFAELSARFSAMEAKLSSPGTAPPAVLPQVAPKGSSKREEVINLGVAVLQARCAACHTGASSKKDPESGNPVVIFSEPGKLSAEVDVVALMLAIEDGSMPKGGAKCTAEEKKTVRDMVRAASRK